MNYIFDVGNVLVTYEPKLYLESLFEDKLLIDTILSSVFDSEQWLLADEGRLTRPEITQIFCELLPQYKSQIKVFMDNINDMFVPKVNTIDLLPKLKCVGHKLYYLSNISFETRDYLLEKYSFFNLFDGGVFSCDEKTIKPNPEIYQILLNKYLLEPKDCIFYDDVQKNIDAARAFGITSVLFDDAACIDLH